MNNQPIGILDSGVGGLTIWREIVKELPNEPTIYLADSKNCPYGTRSEEEIYHLAKRLARFLLGQKVKLIVVACNTITVSCIDKLREEFKEVPIVGTVPAIKTAAKESKNKKIGILSTFTTAQSRYQKNLIDKFAKDCEIVSISASELVPYVERGEIEEEKVQRLTKKILKKFLLKDVDTIVIGCSHFPFLKRVIQEVMGDKVTILDSGEAIARQVRRVLTNDNILSLLNKSSYEFYTTGDASEFTRVSRKVVGEGCGDLIKSVRQAELG